MPDIKNCRISDEKIVALLVSRSGAGKSTAAASFPRPFHQYSFDNRYEGIIAACKPPVGTGFLDPEGLSYTRLHTRNGYEPFEGYMTLLEQGIVSGKFPYKSIEIATVSQLVQALINSSHKLQKGKKIGNLRMSGPGDFGFEVEGMKQVIDFLHYLPCHVMLSAHIIPKWGKPKDDENEYAANEVIGEKLALRDQPGEVILSCFSNVFRFEKELDRNGEMQYYVEFNTDIAKNTFGIPPGRFNVTGKPFFPFLQDLIKRIQDGTFQKPKTATLDIFNLSKKDENKKGE
jgi:hypothetical protein